MILNMHKLLSLLVLATVFGGAVLSQSALAEDGFSEAQKADIQRMIGEYLMENPQIILESVDKYQQDEQQRQEQAAAQRIGDHIGYITRADAPSAGNPAGDIVVVEFFDYNCGYCKRALPDLQAILETDTNVRFVFAEMPILGPSSRTAAEWAMAAHKQGKYFEFHTALMNYRGNKDKDSLKKLAEEAGLDADKMEKDAMSPEIAEMVDKDLNIAREIGIQGTPAFIVDGELFRGYLGKEGLESSIKTAREDKEG